MLVISISQAPVAQMENYAKEVANSAKLLINPDFEDWEDGQPQGWFVTKPDTVFEGEDAGSRKTLIIKADTLVDIRQRPSIEPLLPGDTLIFGVDCHSEVAGAVEAAIRINYVDTAKKPLFHKEVHSGGGWQQIFSVLIMPDEAVAYIEFRIRIPKEEPSTVTVRHAQAEVVPAIP